MNENENSKRERIIDILKIAQLLINERRQLQTRLKMIKMLNDITTETDGRSYFSPEWVKKNILKM